jgi:glutamate dehydrogenase (NAD(P)+)
LATSASTPRDCSTKWAPTSSPSPKKGGIYNEHGIDIAAAGLYYRERGDAHGFPNADAITNEELLTCDCDVLIPAAMENTITETRPAHQGPRDGRSRQRPHHPEADEILRDNGVTVLPDILANAGGVTVSYFEWVQGLQNFFWST